MQLQLAIALLAVVYNVPSAHASCSRYPAETDLCCVRDYNPGDRRMLRQASWSFPEQQRRELSGLSGSCHFPLDSNGDAQEITCANSCDTSCNACTDYEQFCLFVWSTSVVDRSDSRWHDGTVCDDGLNCCFRSDTANPPTDVGSTLLTEVCASGIDYFNGETWGRNCPYNNGGVTGDPHFKTWKGHHYDFMGGCDLTLIHAPDFDKYNNMTINIRTKVESDFSYIESAALQIGNNILQISSYGEYHLNGVLGVQLPAYMSGYSIHHEIVNEKKQFFYVKSSGQDIIKFQVHKAWVSVKFDEPSAERFATSVGMMGSFETGKLMARDGTTVIEMDNAEVLAREWQVRDDQPMLFQTVQAPQYPEMCEMPVPKEEPSETSRRLENSISEELAREACAAAGRTPDEMAGCIKDIISTQDLEMADAGAF